MKKLQLKLDGVKEMLTREQMKKITGGSGSGSGAGNSSNKCCYTKNGTTSCSECNTVSNPKCPKNDEGIQGVLTAC